MSRLSPPYTFLCLAVLVVLLSSPVAAFGAGNIASLAAIEGQNWRHGDIEDTLLNILMSRAAGGKKFSKLDVKRVYFGNWLRDYSQAVDVGTVKYVSAEAIRLILWVLGFMSFGYGTKEFEVTTERLGCYRPEEHIDNPKDYADNIDARQYDRRLRGPVDERRELSINQQTGLKNYIASEGAGITTSAGLVRSLFGRSIQLGRQYARSQNKADLYEALRLLGTGCHCLEDYTAHSNYVELALIELGERGVFPHVGRQTQLNLPGARHPVYPIITGTFGGVDFLHSVMGEFSDKATQSELQELEGTVEASQSGGSVSMLQDLLNQVPDGLFGGKDQAGKADELQQNAQAAQMQNTHITPREPEEWTRQLQEVSNQIRPILEWHDEIMQSITETIEKIPILPELIEQIQDQVNIFVFSLLAPFILPIIKQVKTELNTGSSEIIQSSREKQLIVFSDDRCSDPTHSMLSKDHFSNILNEPAGKTASQVLKWVVPQLIACWDDERIDVNRTLTRIVNGVFHHPALRDHGDDGAADGRRLMFGIVQTWWSGKDEQEKYTLRDQLSRDGVEQGRNHKEGVQDHGHGNCKPLGMPNARTAGSSGAVGGPAAGAILGQITDALSGQSQYDTGATRPSAGQPSASFSKLAGQAVGGGALGGIVGGLAGGIGGDLLGGVLGGSDIKKESFQKEQYGQDGSYTQKYTQTGYQQEQQRYGQAEFSQTNYPGGGRREEFQRFEQEGRDQSGYGEQVIRDTKPSYGGGYEQTSEIRHERPGGAWESEVRHEGRTSRGEFYQEEKHHEGYGGYEKKDSDDDDDSDDERKKQKHKKKHKKHDSDSEDEGLAYGGRAEGRQAYGQQEQEYGEGRFGGERRGHGDEFSGRRAEGYGGESRYEERRSGFESGGMPGGFGDEQSQERRPKFEQGFQPERSRYDGGDEFESRERMPGGFGGGREEGFGGRQEGYGGRGEGFGAREEGFGAREEGFGAREEGYGGREERFGEGREEGFGEGRGGYGGDETTERTEDEGYGGTQEYGEGDDYQQRRGYGDEY